MEAKIIDEEGRLILPLKELRRRGKIAFIYDPAQAIARTIFDKNKTKRILINNKVRKLFQECIEEKKKRRQ